MNQHANELEKLLLAQNVKVIKTVKDWLIVGKNQSVHYRPDTGVCWSWRPWSQRTSEKLRGSPSRIAEILLEKMQ